MKRFDSINVIPFIDIMLVLLAIVLTTATFITQAKIDINLPETESSHTTENIEGVELSIDNNEIIYYDKDSVELNQLQEKLALLRSDTPITLRIDKEVRFNRFIEVIDLLKMFNLETFSILTIEKN